MPSELTLPADGLVIKIEGQEVITVDGDGAIEAPNIGEGGGGPTAWVDVTDKPTTFPPDPHSHTYASVTSKPSTFPPDPHNHTIGDTTGLQTALDGKATTGHTHAELPTPGQKNALAGAHGTPGTGTEYLTKASIGAAGVAGKALAADDPTTTNARTPTAHTQLLASITDAGTAASRNVAASGDAAAAEVVKGNDSRLTDARTPLGHNHTASQVTDFNATGDARWAAIAAVPNASYRTILDSSGSHTAARVAGTYGFAQGQPLAISGTGTLYPLNTIYIAAADFPTLNGVAPKLRVRAQLYTNDVAPTGNYTVALHPITRPATSGGAGLCIFTIGAAVTGSAAATFTAPAADASLNQVGSDFALPSDGHYVLGVVTTATVAANSHVHLSASLQMRNA